ncbi:MAG: hypothetical protein IJX55_11410 [Clostridia bacterium]|nr:hypothetical protein [Clostridia bacterium]MBQ8405005.1 hypothetical protein [Clostridia bacterium]
MKIEKGEKLQDAIGMVGDDLVAEAAQAPKRAKSRRKIWVSALAASLALCIIAFAVLNPFGPTVGNAYALVLAEYPETPRYPDGFNYYDSPEYEAWSEARSERWAHMENIDVEAFTAFIEKTVPEFLNTENGKNSLYSPLNVYMALAMLAETAGGESREQILGLLGMGNIDALRTNAHALWNLSYIDDGTQKCLLANSVWLNEGAAFKQAALENLSKHYYASAFRGEMGAEDYNKALRNWLNEQTGGFLKEQVEGMGFSAETVMALASTLWFKGAWRNEFSENGNAAGIFQTPNGEIECEFMNKTLVDSYYYLSNFAAVSLGFKNGGQMFFILPDEGFAPEDLLASEELAEFIAYGGSKSPNKFTQINLSVPKFDVSDDTDLKEGLENLGVTDVFDPEKADFSTISNTPLFVTQASHSVRVTIDEQGCEAAAITIFEAGAGLPKDEVDFVLDRPFIFVITSDVGLPLFVGVVNVPN